MTPLAEWETFYVIIGTSAGALTGLQFVVMALIADLPVQSASSETADAFATPTVVHFGQVLLLSGILSAPWDHMGPPIVLCVLSGFAGIIYTIVIVRRLRKQKDYQPVFEDWLFHVLLPLAAYGALVVTALFARSDARSALFAVAAAPMVLMFIGIHNAWDSVTYVVFIRKQEQRDSSEPRG